MLLALGTSVVPDDAVLPFGVGKLTAGQMRDLFRIYGDPFVLTHGPADRQLVRTGVLRAHTGPARGRPCVPLTEPLRFRPSASVDGFAHREVLRSRGTVIHVEARRFGRTWIPLATVRPGQQVDFGLPGLGSSLPWEIRVDGACRATT